MSTATASNGSQARRAHRRALGWSLVAILVGAMVAPLGGYVYVAYAQEEPAWQERNPRGATWGSARAGGEGYTSASGPYTTSNFIANGGENWRNTRNGPVATYTPWLMALSLLAIGLFHIVVGQSRLEGPPTGRRVRRWAGWERALHWFTATSFILMAITGLSLMFGRAVLIPVLGAQGFSAWATFSMGLHNFLGPLFTVGVLLMIIAWIKDNIPNRFDLEWFRKGGGMFGGKHPSAGRMNGGEKVWFWILVVVGFVLVCITGLILDFPNFGQSREVMQLSNVIHAVAAIIWIAIAFGHIYIGTAGTEGALEGMTTGYVREEWARQHHDLWLEEVKAREGTQPAAEEPSPGGPAHGPAQRSP